jgi:hypothetical protein
MDITKEVLDNRQIGAGLKVEDSEDFVFLTTKGGRRLGVFTPSTTKSHIKEIANLYLSEIDYQE